MPYDIRREHGLFCVVKSDTGDSVKCYRRLANAKRLLRALYANVEDAERAYRNSLLSMYAALTGLSAEDDETKRLSYQVGEAIRAEKWSDKEIDRRSFTQCTPVDLSAVEDKMTLKVMAVPFNIVDGHNTYFNEDTKFSVSGSDLAEVPVYDSHGLKGSLEDTTPLGRVIKWESDQRGLWATVRLNPEDQRSERFSELAAQCNLGASIGMLRAGMFPQPPLETNGVFENPTLLIQAPIVELSLIPAGELEPSNPAASAGYKFVDNQRGNGGNMCKDCQQDFEKQIEELRAELDKARKEREEAVRALAAQQAEMRAQAASQRLKAYNLPQSVVDEFLNVYNAVSMGDQDKLIVAIGKMLDYVRCDPDKQASQVGADMRAMLVKQMIDPNVEPNHKGDDSLVAADREWFARRMSRFQEAKK